MKKANSKPKISADNRRGLILLAALVSAVIFQLLFVYLAEVLTLKIYAPEYFAYVRLPANMYLAPLPFAGALVIAVTAYIFAPRKISLKKYIGIASGLLAAVLFATIAFCSRTWVFNKDTVSYNTLFAKDKVVYQMRDIRSAEARLEYSARVTHLEYVLEMNDGGKVEFDLYSAFADVEEKLIAFDRSIADKRTLSGEFQYAPGMSDAVNEYYENLFREASAGKEQSVLQTE